MTFRDLSLAAVIAVGGLSACDAATQSNVPTPAPAETPIVQKTKPLDSKYTVGMAYAPFRKLLLTDGWQPAASLDECLKLTVGDDYKGRCQTAEIAEVCRVCNDFREISGCADDGYCYMTFSNGGQSLSVKAYGDIMRLRHDGSEPVVEEWAISVK